MAACLFLPLSSLGIAFAQVPVDVRLENFTVMPSTGPVINALVRNRSSTPLQVTVRAQWPGGWKVQSPPPLSIAPGMIATAAFTIEQATDREKNAYPVTLEVEASGKVIRKEQLVAVATAPYLKPKIDGQIEDWKDAVPIEFSTGDKATSVITCWNRKQFCLAVRINGNGVLPSGNGASRNAIQFALTPSLGASPVPAGKSLRYEFVVLGEQEGVAPGFLLLRPEDDLALAEQPRPLAGLACPDVLANVIRTGDSTIYELAIPLSLMPELRATPGRAFGFSLLVHEPGSLGDLGTVMGWWPDQRNPSSWSRWEGAAFGGQPPFPSNAEFGFSSSIH